MTPQHTDKCPKCGAKVAIVREPRTFYAGERATLTHSVDCYDCLRNQLAALTAKCEEREREIERLNKELYKDWSPAPDSLTTPQGDEHAS